MTLLCIYHGNCADGFGSAWVVYNALGAENVEFVPGVYQNPPPDVAGRSVLMVDFSYKRAIVEDMLAKASEVMILDHHKTAIEDLSPLIGSSKLRTVFDVQRSGAGITWDWFHPTELRPDLIDHIEDRDLWRFKLPNTREIQAAVFSYPYDFEVWSELMRCPVAELAAEGVAIERKHHKDIGELVNVCKRRMVIAGYTVWGASLPYTLASDAGHLMADAGEPFAACYWDTPEGRVFSLRSRDDGADVSEIAKQYGGGGHKHASGFRVPLDQINQFEIGRAP